MAPGPYQSNLFRFAIGQYRQGMDRHRRAVRGARSTAVLGIGLGAAVTALPVYGLIRVSQVVSRTLRTSVTDRHSPRIGPKVTELLDFSDFDTSSVLEAAAKEGDVAVADESLSTQAMVRTLLAVGACLSPKQVAQLTSMKMDLCDRAQTDAPQIAPVFDDSMVPLPTLSSGGLPLWGSLTALGQLISVAFSKRLTADGEGSLMENKVANLSNRPSSLSRITGVASDVATRSLVLITEHKVIWPGLSAPQQQQLQNKIGLFLNGHYPMQAAELEWVRLVQRTALTVGSSLSHEDRLTAFVQRLLPKAAPVKQSTLRKSTRQSQLVRPMRTFWIDVLRVVSWLYQRRGFGPIETLPSGLSQLVGQMSVRPTDASQTIASSAISSKTITAKSVSSEGTVNAAIASPVAMLAGAAKEKLLPNAVHDVTTVSIPADDMTATSRGSSAAVSLSGQVPVKSDRDPVSVNNVEGEGSFCLEADVISIDYIEHPLEKLLKWVDRLLLWLEKRWQWLKDRRFGRHS